MALKQKRMWEARQELLCQNLEPDGSMIDVLPAHDYYKGVFKGILNFGVVFLHAYPHWRQALKGKHLLSKARFIAFNRRKMLIVEVDDDCKIMTKDLVYVRSIRVDGVCLAYVESRDGNILHLMCVQLGRLVDHCKPKKTAIKIYRYRRPVLRQQGIKIKRRKKL